MFNKLLLILALVCTQAFAWEPTKPINVYIGFPPGSGDDTVTRSLTKVIEKQNPETKFIINNKPGAGGVIDLNSFVDKPNDGYHLKVIGRNSFTTNPILNKDIVKYQESEFDKILTMAASPIVAVVGADSSLNNLNDLKNLIKSSTTPTLVASNGGLTESVFRVYLNTINVPQEKITIVNYKGPVETQMAVVQKEVSVTFAPLTTALTLYDSGKTKFIAVFSDSKIKEFPSTPLAKDFDKSLVFYSSWGIGLPKNTAKEIKDWFEEKFVKAIRSEQAAPIYNATGLIILTNELTAAGYTKGTATDRELFEKVLK
jgi:tripartite-type tricarboxylate transporter receptor subunit TctC